MIYLGSDIKDIYVGQERIIRGYIGSELFYEYKSGGVLPTNCLCFTAEADSSSVTLNQVGTPTISKNLYYSLTGDDKNTYTCGTTISLNKGDKLYMWSDDSNAVSESKSIYKKFSTTGIISASGDVQSLMNGSDTVGECGYAYLFQNCKLASPPELSATTVGVNGYESLFAGSNITTAPKLPATNLSQSSYASMFNDTKITKAPELPATKLAKYCYQYMFYKCTTIESATLPATTLVSNCYKNMFSGCTKLNYIKAMFLTTPSTSYTGTWVYNVASSGTFVKNVDATWSVSGPNGIPSGWTVKTADS